MGKTAATDAARFFTLSVYWGFSCEESFILVKSLQRMKATGIAYHFTNKASEIDVKILEGYMTDESQDLAGSLQQAQDVMKGFSNGVTHECFIIFTYGTACSLFALLWEIFFRSALNSLQLSSAWQQFLGGVVRHAPRMGYRLQLRSDSPTNSAT